MSSDFQEIRDVCHFMVSKVFIHFFIYIFAVAQVNILLNFLNFTLNKTYITIINAELCAI